ncbi:hypothetical protein F4819DRAFT_509673 [Hypoxylon fuscum]|nr:hypothetical protein F4819DRAFT_509673 [Hypoxylon fuscum]
MSDKPSTESAPLREYKFLQEHWARHADEFKRCLSGATIQNLEQPIVFDSVEYLEQPCTIGKGTSTVWIGITDVRLPDQEHYSVRVPTIRIKLPTLDIERWDDFRRGLLEASKVLSPYIEYYTGEVYSSTGVELLRTYPNTALLPVPGCEERYVHWPFGSAESLTPYVEDPLAVWQAQQTPGKGLWEDGEDAPWSITIRFGTTYLENGEISTTT